MNTTTENNSLQEFLIKRDGLPPIKFKGREIESVTSHGNRNSRWTVLALYKTKGGKYVIKRNYRTIWEGERDSYEAACFDSVDMVIDWLKNDEGKIGPLSQELIENVAKVEKEFDKTWVEEVE
jgi:hypothetical protein